MSFLLSVVEFRKTISRLVSMEKSWPSYYKQLYVRTNITIWFSSPNYIKSLQRSKYSSILVGSAKACETVGWKLCRINCYSFTIIHSLLSRFYLLKLKKKYLYGRFFRKCFHKLMSFNNCLNLASAHNPQQNTHSPSLWWNWCLNDCSAHLDGNKQGWWRFCHPPGD